MAISPSADSSLKGARILVVEDEWLISILLTDLLREFGCEVVGPANCVAQALDLISVERIDCALLDLNVGNEPVYPAAQMLSERSIPFAFTTGHNKLHISESFRERPVLQKPYRDKTLIQVLRDMLTSSGFGAGSK